MAYPFTNNKYAQSSYDGQHNYSDPYSGQPTQFGTSADRYQHEEAPYSTGQQQQQQYGGSYEHEPSMVARDAAAANDDSSVNGYDTYRSRPNSNLYGIDNNEKMLNEGASPYSTSPDMTGISPYSGKSIWTADDKRVMAKRSAPVKILRTLVCLIINVIIVILSIISLVVIFARPPNVGIGNIVTPDASSVGVSGSAITLNGSVAFIISNPNSISATLGLKANIYDKVDTSQAIGTGSVQDQKIEPHSNTTINFPFQVRYDPTKDTKKTILKDLATKCGLTGGSKEDLDLTLKINAKLRILSVPIPVAFSQDMSFICPLSADTLKSLGANDILGLLDDVAKRSLQYLTTRYEL